jgi:hypothetical protein
MLTDGSKYGTAVQLPRGLVDSDEAAQVTLKAGEDWNVPSAANAFTLCLGTHGANFEAKWRPTGVAFVSVPESMTSDLTDLVRASGAFRVALGSTDENIASAQLVVTPRLKLLSPMVAALCLGRPIVGPEYFRAIATKLTVKVPPQDPASLSSLPPDLDPMWAELLLGDKGRVADVDRNIFLPRPERSTLLSGTTFVCLQDELRKELQSYVPLAGGRVDYDPITNAAVSARTGNVREVLQPWATRHHKHVIVYTSIVPINQTALDVLRGMGLVTADYTDVVKSILYVDASLIPDPRSRGSDRFTATVNQRSVADLGRASTAVGGGDGGAADVVDVDMSEAAQGPLPPQALAATAAPLTPVDRRRERPVEGPLGAEGLSRLEAITQQPRPLQPPGERRPHAPNQKDVDNAAGGMARSMKSSDKADEADLIIRGPPRLPEGFPCFHEPHVHNRPILAGGAGGGGQKRFVKQRVREPPAAYVEMVSEAPNRAAAEGRVPVVANVDALDIIPDYGGFDAVPAFGQGPRPRRVTGPAGTTTTTAAAAGLPSVLDTALGFGDGGAADAPGATAPVPAAAPRAARGRKAAAPRAKAAAKSAPAPRLASSAAPAASGGGGIFDVDALY